MGSIPRRLVGLLAAGGFLLSGAQAMATEVPKYTVVSTSPDFEVRDYGPTVVAETEVSGDRDAATSEGFRRLAGYIFGGNRGRQSIAMTAPVAQTDGERIAMTAPVAQVPGMAPGTFVVNFTMPARWTLATLPVPNDARVALREVPGRRVAVLRYSGTWSEKRYLAHVERLRTALAREGLSPSGPPVWARYDPPWTPWFLRRNEVQFDLAPPPPPGR
jgi:hypothetical protein